MKNDIIGTFAILIVGIVFLFFAKNYSEGELWPYDLSISGSQNNFLNNPSQNDGVQSPKPTNTTPPLSHLENNLPKILRKEDVSEMQVGQIIFWEGEAIPGARALSMESKFDNTGKWQLKQRNWLKSKLKEIGFRVVTPNKDQTCLTNEKYGFNDCLDFFTRGAERCQSLIIMAPIDANNVEKQQQKKVQVKLICGSIEQENK